MAAGDMTVGSRPKQRRVTEPMVVTEPRRVTLAAELEAALVRIAELEALLAAAPKRRVQYQADPAETAAVQARMTALGCTRAGLARQLGIPESSVKAFLLGTHPALAFRQRILEALGL